MIKHILLIILYFACLFGLVHGVQAIALEQQNYCQYSLFNTNLFFAISSAIICIAILAFSLSKKLNSQLGFIYFPSLFIKGILFFVVFNASIFSLENLGIEERLNLLIPLFIFLALEVYFVAKFINHKA
jgi:hypothetical protein